VETALRAWVEAEALQWPAWQWRGKEEEGAAQVYAVTYGRDQCISIHGIAVGPRPMGEPHCPIQDPGGPAPGQADEDLLRLYVLGVWASDGTSCVATTTIAERGPAAHHTAHSHSTSAAVVASMKYSREAYSEGHAAATAAIAAAFGDGAIHLLCASLEPVAVLPSRGMMVTALATGGSMGAVELLLAGHPDGAVVLWDCATVTALHTLTTHTRPACQQRISLTLTLATHTRAVSSVQAVGRRFISGAHDGRCIIWDNPDPTIAPPTEVQVLGHDGQVQATAAWEVKGDLVVLTGQRAVSVENYLQRWAPAPASTPSRPADARTPLTEAPAAVQSSTAPLAASLAEPQPSGGEDEVQANSIKSQSEAMFIDLDTDEDGYVDPDELLAVLLSSPYAMNPVAAPLI
jgi:hypothetical protein